MVDGHGDAVDDPSLADPALPWDRERADVGGDREQQEEHERGHPLHSFGWGHQPFRDFLKGLGDELYHVSGKGDSELSKGMTTPQIQLSSHFHEVNVVTWGFEGLFFIYCISYIIMCYITYFYI